MFTTYLRKAAANFGGFTNSISRLGLGALATLLCLAVPASTAMAEPTYGVMNAEGGIYWRSAPDWNTPVQTVGFGFYPDTVITVHCYQAGAGNVPGSADYMWEYATDVGGSGFGTGWINEHFINDGQPINVPSPGVPSCGGGAGEALPAPSLPPGTSPPSAGSSAPKPAAVYFNPFARNDSTGPHLVGDGATVDLPRGGAGDWYGGCGSSRRSYEVATSIAAGRPITTLSGWSLGRMGILSYLANAKVDELKQVNYVLLIDPAKLASGGMKCDLQSGGGNPYVRWLHVNPAAHLVIISGSLAQNENSRGIQEAYFNDMREGPYPEVTSRVLVCNYPIDHEQAFWSSRYWIQHQIGSARNSCPRLSVGGRGIDTTAGWHP